MKDPEIIYLQREEDETFGRTWCEDKIYDDDMQYIRADIVRSEISCRHCDMSGFEKSVYGMSLDGVKRIMRVLRG